MLDSLGGKPGQGAGAFVHVHVLPGDGNAPVPFRLPDAFQRQAAFLCFILPVFIDDLRIQHHHDQRSVAESDDPLPLSDHIRRQSHTAVRVGPQRIHQVFRDRQVRGGCRQGLAPQKDRIVNNLPYHVSSSLCNPLQPIQYRKKNVSFQATLSQNVSGFNFFTTVNKMKGTVF